MGRWVRVEALASLIIVAIALSYVHLLAMIEDEEWISFNDYAIEVVLNKPSVSVDRNALENTLRNLGFREVSEDFEGFVRQAWIARWNLGGGDWVYVQIEFQRLSCEERSKTYLAIRIQDKFVCREKKEGYESFTVELNKTISIKRAYEVLRKYDFQILKYLCRRPSTTKVNVTDCIVRGLRNINGVDVEVQIIVLTTTTNDYSYGDTMIWVVVHNTSVSKELTRLLEEMLSQLVGERIEVSFTLHVYQVPVSCKAVHSEEVLKNVLRQVLITLNKSRAIVIDAKTVEEILDSIHIGYAGWNDRLVYSSKRNGWYRYGEVFTEFNGCLIKTVETLPVEDAEKMLAKLDALPLVSPLSSIEKSTNTRTTISTVHESSSSASVSKHRGYLNAYMALLALGLAVAVAIAVRMIVAGK